MTPSPAVIFSSSLVISGSVETSSEADWPLIIKRALYLLSASLPQFLCADWRVALYLVSERTRVGISFLSLLLSPSSIARVISVMLSLLVLKRMLPLWM